MFLLVIRTFTPSQPIQSDLYVKGGQIPPFHRIAYDTRAVSKGGLTEWGDCPFSIESMARSNRHKPFEKYWVHLISKQAQFCIESK